MAHHEARSWLAIVLWCCFFASCLVEKLAALAPGPAVYSNVRVGSCWGAAPGKPRRVQPRVPLRASAEIIDGKAIAQEIRQELAVEVSELRRQHGVTPGLAVVLVGARRDSATYVRMKKAACEEVGIRSVGVNLPADVTAETLLETVGRLAARPDVHGVLVQLPLPPGLDARAAVDAIGPEKDVDGLHPVNVAALALGAGSGPSGGGFHVACTPLGCIELLDRSGVQIAGQRAAVLGRSATVGVPAALLLLGRDATVTVAHSRTPAADVAAAVRDADIVVAAAGRAGMIKGDWLKPGATVLDVGINAMDDPSKKAGYRLVGDVDFGSCSAVAGKITPVPGGVGPMTVAMLLRNTVNAAKRAAAATAAARVTTGQVRSEKLD